ncbi:cAMP-binding domain of CRP or a regulatory subunit of cAMP-dependent protein kinases [Filimonas lacunae]|uniref:cAMP-binding domain of CRP or a regulatory subunit of cAMP-dependent protein kinases n=1 Tax=Filimonas lacunae TaxID=477680 RepID=A0A173MI66_9BACT|nr:helix-turn-helix domain-containing protein [Filimonas lacunae]BAV07176.1 transcriptional regulator, AraC family [Filimonas lacunae]SIS93761.1 cAMP-binding domain of CRP or a regulatory subunit of cAMP-dependent protein kinases [Filimonas lacunae]
MSCNIPFPYAAKEDIDYVIQLLSTIYPVSDALKAEFHQHVVVIHGSKNEILARQGEVCNYLYFIKTGAIMGYTLHNRKQITTYISIENEFVSSISGLYGTAPSVENMMTVEPSVLLAISLEKVRGLLEHYFDFNYIVRIMMERYYQDAQERALVIRIGNASERFAYFMRTKPGYLERLSVEHISSFLDIKPATLSRIKKQYIAAPAQAKETSEACQHIDTYIQANKPYTNRNITLAGLAAELEMTPHALSLLLNNHYHLNFTDFINNQRVNSIKEQMSQPGSLQNITIEALATQVGFSSRSAFYNAFKKLVGMSPLQYAQSLAPSSPVL